MPGAGSNGSVLDGRPSELVRFATAGSVDDGKSTLIGRLLYDTKQIFEDQLGDVEQASMAWATAMSTSRLTDGLRAERGAGDHDRTSPPPTATSTRLSAFIIADTPGHEQYTRNMVTGASTAEIALILIDARKGVLEQSRRHAVIASLLQILHVVVCEQDGPRRLGREGLMSGSPTSSAAGPRSSTSRTSPSSRSRRCTATTWSSAPSECPGTRALSLSTTSSTHVVGPQPDRHPLPRPVVVRPMADEYHDYRGYAGQVASGVIKVGNEVGLSAPSGVTTSVAAIETLDGPLEEAYSPLSTVRLENDVDVSRGDIICRAHNHPTPPRASSRRWSAGSPSAAPGLRALPDKAPPRARRWPRPTSPLPPRRGTLLHRAEDAQSLELNEIGRLRLRLSAPLLADEYRRNRATGSFILIDESTNDTVGAGMILDTDGAGVNGARPTSPGPRAG